MRVLQSAAARPITMLISDNDVDNTFDEEGVGELF
jgi:hypothetical protein